MAVSDWFYRMLAFKDPQIVGEQPQYQRRERIKTSPAMLHVRAMPVKRFAPCNCCLFSSDNYRQHVPILDLAVP